MDAKTWISKTKQQMKRAGTYQKHYDPVIAALSDILEQRDRAYEDYLENGAEIVVERTSDRGAVNMAKNPRLQVWNDLNSQALAYWRELGLTPAGLKKINEAAMQKKEDGSVLETALLRLSNGA